MLVWRLAVKEFGGFTSYDAVVVEQPSLRRRQDDSLPTPAERAVLCLALQSQVKNSLRLRFTLLENMQPETCKGHRVLRVKLAVTTALQDRGDTPPHGEWQSWGDRPSNFACECEVIDAHNMRPLAKLIAFDRTRYIDPKQITPWTACASDFSAWASDVAWLVQPPLAADVAPAVVAPSPTAAPVVEVAPEVAPADEPSASVSGPVSI